MRRARTWLRPSVAGVLALSVLHLAGCAAGPPVVRLVNGHIEEGRFISVDAYAAFLRGALAEQDGDARVALGAYEEARAADPHDPETWARLGRVRCRLDRTDTAADAAIQEALRIDPHYEPAALAKGFCATLRGEGDAAAKAYARAATWEPLSVEAEVDAGRVAAASSDAGSLVASRLTALTLLHRDRVDAWEALSAWATAHGDVRLAASAMVQVVRLAPMKQYEVGLSAVALAGAGRKAAALEVAAAVLDAKGDRTAGGMGKAAAAVPLVARLAVDDAIARRDLAAVSARAARAHLAAEVVAGRAWVAGDTQLARTLVEPTVRADPSDLPARLLYDALSARPSSAMAPSASAFPPEVALPLARALVLAGGPEAARRVLDAGGGVRVLAGDALLTSLAVDLAVSGLLAERDLPADAHLELLARRSSQPTDADVADATLDPRHHLFGLSLLHPTDPATVDLCDRLAPAAGGDPLIATALATITVARGALIPPTLRASLDSFAATDPIVASRVLEIARTLGPSAALTQARERLTALARTPAERASAVR